MCLNIVVVLIQLYYGDTEGRIVKLKCMYEMYNMCNKGLNLLIDVFVCILEPHGACNYKISGSDIIKLHFRCIHISHEKHVLPS